MNKAALLEYHYIYKISRFDGKYYFGRHSTNDLNDKYFGSGTYLWHSIKKHGKDKHAHEQQKKNALVQKEADLLSTGFINPVFGKRGRIFSITHAKCGNIITNPRKIKCCKCDKPNKWGVKRGKYKKREIKAVEVIQL